MTEKQLNHNSGRAYLIEVVMFFTYAFFAVNWIAGSGFTTDIMKSFGIESFASASFISNAITIAKIIGNFLAASILQKLMPKKSIMLGSALIVIGSAVAVIAPAYWIFILGRFVMGFGGALYVVYFSPIVIHFFSPDKRPAVNAVNNVAYNFGGFIAMLAITPVLGWLGTWQMSMTFFAGISLLLLILWPFVGEDFELGQKLAVGQAQEKYTIRDAMKEKLNWLLPFTYSGLLTFYIVMLNVFPASGATRMDSKTLSALFTVGGIIGSLLAIALSKVYFKRLPVIRLSGIGILVLGLLLFNIPNDFLSMAFALLIGVLVFLPVTSLVMIPQEIPDMTPAKLTTIMGLFWAIAYVIETILYYIISLIIDNSGHMTALYVALIATSTFVIGSFLLPETGKEKEKTAKKK